MLKIQLVDRRENSKTVTPPFNKETETEETKSQSKQNSRRPPSNEQYAPNEMRRNYTFDKGSLKSNSD
jgi:hypothetical protein